MFDLAYLTVDSVTAGVGASQVLPYVERFADGGVSTTLHSFENRVSRMVDHRLSEAGVRWRPHSFGVRGPIGGLQRLVVGAAAVRGHDVVHARSDLSAASAVLARHPTWLWDVRSFWVDQRIAMGMVRPGSVTDRAMRSVERAAARQSKAITTLTTTAIHELARRHGASVADKATVVTTCVDLERFAPVPTPDGPPRLLLSGSFNPLYDVDAMMRFVELARELRADTCVALVRPTRSEWDDRVQAAGGTVAASTFAEMPKHVANSHAGLALCHGDHRIALAGAMPTKLGEFLAVGRPIVVSRAVGDIERILRDTGAGVVIGEATDDALRVAAAELFELLDDPDTATRCRRVAERHFDLQRGVDTLLEVYRRLG